MQIFMEFSGGLEQLVHGEKSKFSCFLPDFSALPLAVVIGLILKTQIAKKRDLFATISPQDTVSFPGIDAATSYSIVFADTPIDNSTNLCIENCALTNKDTFSPVGSNEVLHAIATAENKINSNAVARSSDNAEKSPESTEFKAGYASVNFFGKDMKPAHVRPGILVLINDSDWELEDGENYVVQDNDVISFISTLHGG